MKAHLAGILAAALVLPASAFGQGVFFNPISAANPVAGGGTDDVYELDNANRAATKVQTAGLTTTVMAGSLSTTANSSAAIDAANTAKASVFVLIYSDAFGGAAHGYENYYYTGSTSGQTLATDLQNALKASYTIPDRGVNANNSYDVLVRATMPAAVTEVLFHDCVTSHASLPSAVSESAFLISTSGRDLISTGIASGTCKYLGKTCPVAGLDAGVPAVDAGTSTCTPGSACSTGKKGVCSAGTVSCSGNTATCNQNTQSSAESCNGLDDNCDGQTDEGDPGGGASCTPGLKGECNKGIVHCSGGHLKCTQVIFPAAETCNGLDDNCDGQTDEGDPGGGGACSTGLKGVCAAGVNHCQGGKIVCVQTTQSSKEICDGLDNNCDGTTDEGGVCNDGGVPAGKDAGSAGLDAATTPAGLDASSLPGLDASLLPGLDASSEPADATVADNGDAAEEPGLDASSDWDDEDGGGWVALPKDASVRKDAGAAKPASSGSCGCTSGGEGMALAGAWALAALLRARRRERS